MPSWKYRNAQLRLCGRHAFVDFPSPLGAVTVGKPYSVPRFAVHAVALVGSVAVRYQSTRLSEYRVPSLEGGSFRPSPLMSRAHSDIAHVRPSSQVANSRRSLTYSCFTTSCQSLPPYHWLYAATISTFSRLPVSCVPVALGSFVRLGVLLLALCFRLCLPARPSVPLSVGCVSRTAPVDGAIIANVEIVL